MATHYRIVTDRFLGFEVQSWRWWWPIWMQCFGDTGPTNTHQTIEEAEAFAKRKAAGVVARRPARRVVRNLGPLPDPPEQSA